MNSRTTVATSSSWITVLCWLTVVFEGFDIVALGAAIPTITNTGYRGLTVESINLIVTFSLVGVGLGAALIGPLSDRFGRRMPLILCVLGFSIFTFIFPLMPNEWFMLLARFVAGLGLGGCMPVAITMMQEAASESRKSRASTLTMTGYHAGAVIASLAAIFAGQHWTWLFYIGGILGAIMVVLMWFKLPETSTHHLPSTSASAPKVRVSELLGKKYARATIGMWVAAFMGLVLVYGLNSWLPKIMNAAGYPVANSLVMLFVLNVGAIVGLLIGGKVSDARGNKGTTVFWFAAAAVLLAVLSLRVENEILLNLVIFVTGIFVFTAQALIYAMTGYVYPRNLVASGMGLVSGVGRLGAIVGPYVTGLLIASGNAYPLAFYMYAGAAVLGMIAIWQIPRLRAAHNATPTATGEQRVSEAAS